MKIVGPNNENAEKAVGDRLYEILRRITSATPLQEGMLFTVRNHFTSIYPGSKHYSPDKVQPLSKSDGSLYGKASEASIDIDVPGITRAYHDLNIKPRFRKALTIPIRREAFGKKASDFEDTFVAKKKGKEGAYIA
ncbi:hypothetical protein [Fibrobacter sp.]|uniref:hypothetical protein n=1 Tax=Fibrobacter sp. TaxID=35828 RepID=UPI00388D4CA2